MAKYPLGKYKFQFNNDADSCIALRDLLLRGWTVQGFIEEDGYTWFLLIKETD